MGFFTGYNSSRALAGLGKLTTSSGAPSKDAKRVVRAFISGEVATGSCKGKKNARSCEVTSDGLQLNIGDYTLAERAHPEAQDIKVCIPAQGEMMTTKRGKVVEVQKSKDVKAAASALLRGFGAGIGVRTDRTGLRRLTGSHGHSAMAAPGECVTVKLSKLQAHRAAAGVDASLAARDQFKVKVPSSKQIRQMRGSLTTQKRVAALEKARAQRALKLGVERAAKAEREALKQAAQALSKKGAKRFKKTGKEGWVAEAARTKAVRKSAAKRFKKSGKKGWVAGAKKTRRVSKK